MIDVTCPACDITYHADEAHIGRGLQCKVCGKILQVERPPSSLSNPGREVLDRIILGDRPKPAIYDHLKTGHRETHSGTLTPA